MKKLLFITPALPRPTGGGLQMRAWMLLRQLAREHAVTLVIGSPAFSVPGTRHPSHLDGLVERIIALDFRSRLDVRLLLRKLATRAGLARRPAWDVAEPTPTMRTQLEVLQAVAWDRIHVHRLYMLPVALAALRRDHAVPIDLDLDDWESETRRSLATLAESESASHAHRLREEAAGLLAWEAEWLPRCARVLVCARGDADALAARFALTKVEVVPNRVAVPSHLPPPGTASPPEMLFVGGLGYLPNRDAVRFLVTGVLPKVSALAGLIVVGSGTPSSMRRLLAKASVSLIEAPEDLEPLYARASLALAPIRAGGGTRIKVLEAFAHGRPVIATAAAVAGLDVRPDRHYLRAETADEWMRTIDALLADPAKHASLAETAFAWVKANAALPP